MTIYSCRRSVHRKRSDPNGGDRFLFWQRRRLTLTQFVQAIRSAEREQITMLTYDQDYQGIRTFQLKGLDDEQRKEMFTEAFDANLSIAAAPHCQVEEEPRCKRQSDDVLELMEQKRESEAFEPPLEAFSDTWKG